MKSLQSRLLLLVGLALLPAILLFLFNALTHRRDAVQAAQASLQRVTRLAAANESLSLNAAQELLKNLSVNPEIFESHDTCSDLMRITRNNNPEYANLGLIRLNGDLACNAIAGSGPVNVADRKYFKDALASRSFVIGGYVFGRISQTHALVLAYPVLDRSGAVSAVLFASLDALALQKFIDVIDLPEGAILETVDRQGVIVSRKPEPDKWLGKSVRPLQLAAFKDPNRSARLLIGDDGVERLHAFADVGPADTTQLLLSIAIPTAQITEPALREQLRTGLILALTSSLALLAAWVAGRRLIIQPVDALVATADEIAAGNYAARTGLPTKKDELSKLARAIDDMAASLGVHTADRDTAREQAQRANGELVKNSLRKDEFLAMLGHELRNPLAPIRNAAYLLKNLPGAEPRVAKFGQIITRQVDHISRLVDDLLDVTRVTRGLVTINAQPVDLNTVVDTAIEQMRPALQAHEQDLSVIHHDGPAILNGDTARLVQVVANLLNNASKFTPERGKIEVSVKQTHEAWEICVADNGIGIDAELLPRVFELFSQGERALDRAGGGLGLGLHLAKGLVEMHGGRISARSEGQGQGSSFTVVLPLAAALTLSEAPTSLTGQVAASAASLDRTADPLVSIRSTSVMIVDDGADIANSTAMLLEAMGYQVTVECTGAAALQRAVVVSPQVCLLDIGMPEMDGYELVRRLRQLPQTQNAVMVAVTGYGQPEDVARATAAGFDHHLLKPVQPEALAALLAAA